MRDTHNVFHLAIPARDLDEAYDFYVAKLGCKLARRYDDRITLDFFGDQVVCHRSDKVTQKPEMYPRHFGVTFRDRGEYDNLLRLACGANRPSSASHLRALRGWSRNPNLFPGGPLEQSPGV